METTIKAISKSRVRACTSACADANLHTGSYLPNLWGKADLADINIVFMKMLYLMLL